MDYEYFNTLKNGIFLRVKYFIYRNEKYDNLNL